LIVLDQLTQVAGKGGTVPIWVREGIGSDFRNACPECGKFRTALRCEPKIIVQIDKGDLLNHYRLAWSPPQPEPCSSSSFCLSAQLKPWHHGLWMGHGPCRSRCVFDAPGVSAVRVLGDSIEKAVAPLELAGELMHLAFQAGGNDKSYKNYRGRGIGMTGRGAEC
jgi:hypothetical protein